MPLKNGKTTKQLKEKTETEEKYEKMACGTQVRFQNGQTSFSCIGRTEPELNCAEQCPCYYRKKQS